ncbi:MAG: 2-hydroxyacyl-CoA dehydratase, partial [Akkermansia muciniphila]|nr:2-hydroxyacyl-CoA dehydratase [Akkermansia muciniphila]
RLGKHIVVLAGRPYHIDPRINHGIDRLIIGLGAAVVTEDAVAHLAAGAADLQVLNQWSYHARLYAAARYVCRHADTEFVQLVSFGCGCDAITADECRRLLENAGRLYTQIKIDDIDNPGAAKIRLRSLFAAAGIREPLH